MSSQVQGWGCPGRPGPMLRLAIREGSVPWDRRGYESECRKVNRSQWSVGKMGPGRLREVNALQNSEHSESRVVRRRRIATWP